MTTLNDAISEFKNHNEFLLFMEIEIVNKKRSIILSDGGPQQHLIENAFGIWQRDKNKRVFGLILIFFKNSNLISNLATLN